MESFKKAPIDKIIEYLQGLKEKHGSDMKIWLHLHNTGLVELPKFNDSLWKEWADLGGREIRITIPDQISIEEAIKNKNKA